LEYTWKSLLVRQPISKFAVNRFGRNKTVKYFVSLKQDITIKI